MARVPEPGGGDGPLPPPAEVLESRDGERWLALWWRRQAPRQRAVLVAGCLGLLLAAVFAWYLTLPQPPPPVPTAWPALHATVTYEGTLPVDDSTQRTADFLISVQNEDAATVTVAQISFSYPGLTVRTDPSLPVQVQPGQSARIQLITTASDCSRIPRSDELPFVDVTFRNMRAIGQESEILGDRYTADLHRAMTAACRRS